MSEESKIDRAREPTVELQDAPNCLVNTCDARVLIAEDFLTLGK
jgi:hypothetical protein